MFEQILVPSKNNATITLPVDCSKKQLLPAYINTNSWKFNIEEANER